ncbi:holin [Arthrobacter phage GantcherGoblin]|nr:holin [Arthrobacter phage GantcherGoblin]
MADHAVEPLPFGFNLPDSVYNVIRAIVEVILPGLSIAYYGLAHTWGLPHADEVAATLAIISAFCVTILKLSRRVYNAVNATGPATDGTLVVSEEGIHGAVLDTLPEDIANKDLVTFKVQNPQNYDAAE